MSLMYVYLRRTMHQIGTQYPPDFCSICAKTPCWRRLLWPVASHSIPQTFVPSEMKQRAGDYCCERKNPTVSTRRLFHVCWNNALTTTTVTGSWLVTCCIVSDLQTFGIPRRAMFALFCKTSGCTITLERQKMDKPYL